MLTDDTIISNDYAEINLITGVISLKAPLELSDEYKDKVHFSNDNRLVIGGKLLFGKPMTSGSNNTRISESFINGASLFGTGTNGDIVALSNKHFPSKLSMGMFHSAVEDEDDRCDPKTGVKTFSNAQTSNGVQMSSYFIRDLTNSRKDIYFANCIRFNNVLGSYVSTDPPPDGMPLGPQYVNNNLCPSTKRPAEFPPAEGTTAYWQERRSPSQFCLDWHFENSETVASNCAAGSPLTDPIGSTYYTCVK
jgi:hypothetical protein